MNVVFRKIFLLPNAYIAVNVFLLIGHSSAELFQSYLNCRSSLSWTNGELKHQAVSWLVQAKERTPRITQNIQFLSSTLYTQSHFVHIEQRVTMAWSFAEQGVVNPFQLFTQQRSSLHHIKLVWLRPFKGISWKWGVHQTVGISMV